MGEGGGGGVVVWKRVCKKKQCGDMRNSGSLCAFYRAHDNPLNIH